MRIRPFPQSVFHLVEWHVSFVFDGRISTNFVLVVVGAGIRRHVKCGVTAACVFDDVSCVSEVYVYITTESVCEYVLERCENQ